MINQHPYMIFKGYFINYRGNWYGPYLSAADAIESYKQKSGHHYYNTYNIVYGIAIVNIKNKKLINFNHLNVPEHVQKYNERRDIEIRQK